MLLSVGQMPLEDGTKMDDILNFKQAAEFLGVSERVLIKLLQEEDVPARKIGKEWRFSKTALFEWLGSGSSRHYAKNAQVDEEEEEE